MKFIKQLKRRYHCYKTIQFKIAIIRKILKETNKTRKEYCYDYTNLELRSKVDNINKDLDKWKASLGHTVLLFLGEFGPLKDDGFDPRTWNEK